MKIVALLVFFGMLQVCVNGVVDIIPTPTRYGHIKNPKQVEKSWDDEWICGKCGNKNYNWTSLCGKCGRSK